MGKLILNGVEYSTSGNLYYPVIYSDTERRIGVWRDNKPLYQKTFNINPTGADTTIDVSSLNIETLVARFGALTRNTGSGVQQKAIEYRTENPSNNTYGIQCEIRDTNLFISISGYTYSQITNIRATIQYTKTTDTAGSGNWNTDGIPTHHYSTNEQVVGTYLNKPLYERVIEINNPDYNWSVINLESYFPNVEKAFLGDMFRATRTDGVVICKPDFYFTDWDRLSFLLAENADNLRVSGYLLSKVAVTKLEFSVRYTKTTD